MIALIIAACLATGECRDFHLLYDETETSLVTCMIWSQPQIADWTAEHPGWTVNRWRCDHTDRIPVDL